MQYFYPTRGREFSMEQTPSPSSHLPRKALGKNTQPESISTLPEQNQYMLYILCPTVTLLDKTAQSFHKYYKVQSLSYISSFSFFWKIFTWELCTNCTETLF